MLRSLWDFHICNRYTEAKKTKTKTILDPEVILKETAHLQHSQPLTLTCSPVVL